MTLLLWKNRLCHRSFRCRLRCSFRPVAAGGVSYCCCLGCCCVMFCFSIMPQVLQAQAEELIVVKFALQELRKEHVSLQVTLQEIQQRFSTAGDDLAAAQ